MLTTDYLIIGSGASGMGFADQMLAESNADIIMVDRHHMPGGHWNDAYSFVRLHQPSAFYGVGSRPLGSGRRDEAGFNKGCYELPTGADVSSYYERLMAERFLPSARVRYFPMCDYLGDGRFRSMLSGEVFEASFRKLVDTTNFRTEVPSTHAPSFETGSGVKLVTPNALPRAAAGHERFVILGGGKTGMDVGVWLLQMGASAEKIRWIVPRDSWLMNRETIQPGEAFFLRTGAGQADQLEAVAEATSTGDLFERLERAGLLLRIDRFVRPSRFRGATISTAEVAMLGAIGDVVRKGHVRSIGRDTIALDDGAIDGAPDALYIDCTASAFGQPPLVPVFKGNRITIQLVRAGQTCLSAALVAHVEAVYADETEKNELCTPVLLPNSDVDWLRTTLQDLRNGRRWGADKALRQWVGEHRLSGVSTGGPDAAARGPEADRIRARMREARPKAEANLARLLGEAG